MEGDREQLIPEDEDDQEENGHVGDEDDSNKKESKTMFLRRLLTWKYWFNLFFIQLTTNGGQEKLSLKKSVFVELMLYASHWCSAWGDRMWSFAISLLLVAIYPESLLMPALYGFAVQLSVVVFATIVGDWVDHYSRLRGYLGARRAVVTHTVVFWSLILQNSLVVLCSAVLAVAFKFEVSACTKDSPYFGLVAVGVVILGSSGNLATLGNTISIERDWVVAIAEKNKLTLSVLNANMRRIDLCCKLLAPTLTGVILSTTSPFVCTLFVAGWNVVSFFVEFGLIYVVYKAVPQLKVKKIRSSKREESKKDTDGSGTVTEGDGVQEDPTDPPDDGVDVIIREPEKRPSKFCHCKGLGKILRKLLSPIFTIIEGWRIYKKQSVAIVGMSMATIYLTVLGFSGVTSAYFKTQRVDEALIGLSQGIGAIIGITGTFFFQPIRERIGTVRAGLVGISLQLSVLALFTGTSLFFPGYPIPDTGGGYFDPHCNVSSSSVLGTTSTITMSPSSVASFPTLSLISPSATPTPSTPSVTPGPPPVTTPLGTVHVALMLIGVLGARFGLWMFDLAVSQLVQENVPEEERGVFSGVMNVFISVMDMLHYVLVIVAPRPEHFRYLAIVSIVMVVLGYIQYAVYVRKVRGHFFHCGKLFGKCRGKQRTTGHYRLPQSEECVVKNEDALNMTENI